jgi:hypothetical protein
MSCADRPAPRFAPALRGDGVYWVSQTQDFILGYSRLLPPGGDVLFPSFAAYDPKL